jgi:hypothetical protein
LGSLDFLILVRAFLSFVWWSHREFLTAKKMGIFVGYSKKSNTQTESRKWEKAASLEMAMGRNPSGSAVPYPHMPTLTLPAKNLYPHAGSSSYTYLYPLPVGWSIPDSIPVVN